MADHAATTSTATTTTPAEFWLFGYGSLIWKPPPHYDQRVPGWVTGYVRRFWQHHPGSRGPWNPPPEPASHGQTAAGKERDRLTRSSPPSEDHRGTPEAPGRVVTLIERSFWASLADAHDSAPDRVWGVAYRIRADKVAEVKDYLDIREINGYTIHYTPFHPADGSPSIRTLVYIGTPENPQFTGAQEPQALAEHIYRSEGPSGLNRDYLLSLEEALNQLSPESGDAHITDLSDRVRDIARKARQREGADPAHPTSHEFRRKGSVDEQEETEKI